MSGPGGAMGLMSNPGKLQEMMADPEVSLDDGDHEVECDRDWRAGIRK